jgi:hypothetical protein
MGNRPNRLTAIQTKNRLGQVFRTWPFFAYPAYPAPKGLPWGALFPRERRRAAYPRAILYTGHSQLPGALYSALELPYSRLGRNLEIQNER